VNGQLMFVDQAACCLNLLPIHQRLQQQEQRKKA